MRKQDDDRILDADEGNSLVRHYTHIDQSQQTAEDWWGGAVALDHFLEGLPHTVEAIATTSLHSQHQWRAWVVNTESSKQVGSHWFTVVLGTEMQLLQSNLSQLRDSNMEEHSVVSGSRHITATPSAAGTAREYPHIFGASDPELSSALDWARANAMRPDVASWMQAREQWDVAIAA